MNALASPIPTGFGRDPHGAIAAFLPIIARCPGCACDMRHPLASSCDRIGCPIRHISSASHVGASA